MTRLRKILAASSLVVLAGVSTMSAATVTYTTTIADAPVSFSDTVQLQGFNSSLGTLTGVALTLSATGNVDVALTDISQTSYSYTNATATTMLSVTGPAGLVIPAFAESASSASGTIGFGTTVENTQSYSASKTANPADLSDYLTSGNVTLDFIGSAISSSGTTNAPSNTVFFGGGADASGSISVTYTYTPAVTTGTPEPATMALLGGGLLGLGFLRRRLHS